MSEESYEWLNSMTLIGFTAKRGDAWHYREDLQGDQPNHYPLEIPVEDVISRLFFWKPVKGTSESTYRMGNRKVHFQDRTRSSIIRPAHTFGEKDGGEVFGYFKKFEIHDYRQWLITNVEVLLDDRLQIGSAGLLKGGAVAWVQVEMPENIKTPEGVEFRPFLTAATALDGSLSSTYQTGSQLVVCDNTLSAALDDKSHQVKIKHSKNSLKRIPDVRVALGMVYEVAEQFEAQVKRLCAVEVTPKQWAKFLDATAPIEGKEKRALTMAENQRLTLNMLWNSDPRVAPWQGTAFGVVQAMNTYTHHFGIVRNTSRSQRNMLRVVTGGVDDLDQATLDTLQKVMAA